MSTTTLQVPADQLDVLRNVARREVTLIADAVSKLDDSDLEEFTPGYDAMQRACDAYRAIQADGPTDTSIVGSLAAAYVEWESGADGITLPTDQAEQAAFEARVKCHGALIRLRDKLYTETETDRWVR